MKILIAEDDFPSRGMLAAVLRKAEHEPGGTGPSMTSKHGKRFKA